MEKLVGFCRTSPFVWAKLGSRRHRQNAPFLSILTPAPSAVLRCMVVSLDESTELMPFYLEMHVLGSFGGTALRRLDNVCRRLTWGMLGIGVKAMCGGAEAMRR
jgi:hypothetical protein